ncbi:hypothetical protein EON63_11255 [archaeon]|nr:MAG: hypothetical protein EON63_11255 [archaeon]
MWQISHAKGGDFVVLRTSGDDAYNPYIYDLSVASGSKLNSVTTILFRNKRASDEAEVHLYFIYPLYPSIHILSCISWHLCRCSTNCARQRPSLWPVATRVSTWITGGTPR